MSKVELVGQQQAMIYDSPTPLFNIICVHGAGFTGNCWNAFINALQNIISVRVIVVELRGHGLSKGDCSELSLSQLLTDLDSFKVLSLGEKPSFLIGHSLGGSLVARISHSWPNCIGVCLLDITEESALFSINKMQNYLQNRPQNFDSVEDASKWFFKTTHPTTIQVDCLRQQLQQNDKEQKYYWSIPLIKSKPFWNEWFVGMNEAFLSAPVDIRMLVLAGNNEQLDGHLTMAQMQGKFQLQILPRTSHAIMLDSPQVLAQIIASNLQRFSILRNKMQ